MRYLKVPGKWLEACGKGSADRIFPVIDIDETRLPNGQPATFVGVDDNGWRWVVHMQWRGATFVNADGTPEERGLPMGFGRPDIAKRCAH